MNELDTGAKRVLEQGLKLDGPSEAARQRVKRRLLLAVSGGAGLVAGTAPVSGAAAPALAGALAGTKGLGAGSLALWFAIGLGAGAGVVGSALLVTRAASSEERGAATTGPAATTSAPRTRADSAAASGDAPSVSEPAALAVAEGGEPAKTVPRVDPGSRGERAATRAHAPSPTAAPAAASAPAVTASALSEELALLERAQRALAAHDPGAAMLALDEHERRFARGALAEERSAARVLALCDLGRVEQAAVIALALVRARPESVLVPRLERSCVGPLLER